MSQTKTFEKSMKELEDTVKKLEGGSLTLDESLDAYEKAIKLVKECNEKLDLAEQRIRVLTESADGVVTDAPFFKEDEN